MSGGGWWRPDTVQREAAANLLARRGRFAVLAAMVAAVVGALLWVELTTARAAVADKQDFLAAGGTVVVVGRETGGLDAATCAALSRQPHVVAAGGVSRGEVVHFDHAPGTPFQSVHVSGDLLRVLDPTAPVTVAGGLVLPVEAAAELGVGPGSSLAIAGDVRPVGAVVDVDLRAQTLSRSVLLPQAPAGEVEQCWVEFDDGAHRSGVATMPAWFAGDEVTVSPLIDRNRATRDFAAEWSGRSTRYSWLAAAALVTAFILLSVWQRRAEQSLYVLLGTPRPVVALLQTLELWCVVTVGGLLGTAWGAAVAALTGHPGGTPLVHGLRAAVLSLTLALALIPLQSAWLLRCDLVAMLKQRPG